MRGALFVIIAAVLPSQVWAQGGVGEQDISCLIQADKVLELSSSVRGVLTKVHVKRGERVGEGQVVAELESGVERATLEAANALAKNVMQIQARKLEYQKNKRNHDRIAKLSDKNVVAAQQLDEIATEAELSKASLAQARFEKKLAEFEAKRAQALLDRRIIKSPVNGVVTDVRLHGGEYVGEAASILTVAQTEPLKVEAYLPVSLYSKINVGTTARVRPQDPIGGAYTAKVAAKDPVIDSASGTFQISLTLPNTKGVVPAGINCKIQFD